MFIFKFKPEMIFRNLKFNVPEQDNTEVTYRWLQQYVNEKERFLYDGWNPIKTNIS